MKGPIELIETSYGNLWVAHYRHRRYRVLLDNGTMIDVTAVADNSTLREAILDKFTSDKTTKIAGVADLGYVDDATIEQPELFSVTQ